MQVADAFWVGSGIIYPRGAHEESDQPSIACVEVEVGLVWDIEIGLLHNQGHPQYSLVEIDGRLPVGTNKCDMVNTLSLDFRHGCTSTLGIGRPQGIAPTMDALLQPIPDCHSERDGIFSLLAEI